MMRWIGSDPNRRRTLLLILCAALLLYAITVLYVVPQLIRSAYAGESLPVLNRIIQGRDQHSVEVYLSLWRRTVLLLTPAFVVTLGLVYWTRHRWARLPGHLRRVADALAERPVSGLTRLAIAVGVVGGLAEAVNGIVRHRVRHLPTGEFVASELFWLAPLAASGGLIALGLALILLDRASRARGALIGAGPYLFIGVVLFSFLRSLVLGFATYAAVLLAGGVAVFVVQAMMRRREAARRALRFGVPALVAALVLWAMIVPIARRVEEKRAVSALPAAQPGAPNVLILIWDAVRARNVSAHGYARRTTPTLETLARRGVVFERAFSTSPWSLPSHASIFTGRTPPEMTAGYSSPLDDEHPTLAEVLSREGYVTGGFTANLFFGSADYGIARGFSYYDSRPPLDVTTVLHTWWASRRFTQMIRHATGYHQTMLRRNAANVSAAFDRWVRRREGRPFLAVLNHFDAHEPYLAPKPFNLAFSDQQPRYWFNNDEEVFTDSVLNELKTAYDTCILYVDSELAKLLDLLEREGELDNTLIIVTSDHGEEFGEYHPRVVGHSKTMHAHALHVPLVILPPGGTTAERRTDVVSIRDIPATIMDVLGLSDRSPFPGVALLQNQAGQADPWVSIRVATMERHRFGNARAPWPSAAGAMFSLFAGDWHYILDAKHGERLYNMASDPWEKHDLSTDAELQPLLERFREALDTIAPGEQGVRRARRTRTADSSTPR